MPDTLPLQQRVAALSDNLARLPRLRDRDFAMSLCNFYQNRGRLSENQERWLDILLERAQETQSPVIANNMRVTIETPSQNNINIGNLSGLLQLFARARQHLTRPAIVLNVPEMGLLRISVAGPNARVPGSLDITNQERPSYGRRPWYGRVHLDGRLEFRPGGWADDNSTAVTSRLVALASDPVRVASEHGRLTGRCMFCNLHLTDSRSTAIGYGPVCATHYGLPWGERPAAFADAVLSPAVRSQRSIEAELRREIFQGMAQQNLIAQEIRQNLPPLPASAGLQQGRIPPTVTEILGNVQPNRFGRRPSRPVHTGPAVQPNKEGPDPLAVLLRPPRTDLTGEDE